MFPLIVYLFLNPWEYTFDTVLVHAQTCSPFNVAGFIMMCPQLFINYKLKSVAHLPWRQMTYKFLNTIIDDLFAFVIKMPTLHRLSVFRDGKIESTFTIDSSSISLVTVV